MYNVENLEIVQLQWVPPAHMINSWECIKHQCLLIPLLIHSFKKKLCLVQNLSILNLSEPVKTCIVSKT